MNVEYAVQKAYYTALQALSVPVYSDFSIEPTREYPFIKITGIQANQEITNGCRIYNVFVTVEAITGSVNNVGRKEALTLGASIDGIINSGSNIAIDAPFEFGNTYLLNSETLDAKSGVYFIYRNLRTYQHKINITT